MEWEAGAHRDLVGPDNSRTKIMKALLNFGGWGVGIAESIEWDGVDLTNAAALLVFFCKSKTIL